MADMQKIAPYILIGFAVVFLVLMISDKSYSRLSLIKDNISTQVQKNSELRTDVLELKSKVYNLQNNPRDLEKSARNKLGMARPDEDIFIFEKKAK
jgi:cell division protein FtsB